MYKNKNIIPQIIYSMILNINYNNTFYKLRFKFKNSILLFRSLWYKIFFILILNKRFIYFVNSITCKSKNIIVILFIIYIIFLLIFILNLSYQNHNKWWCFYNFSYDFNLIVDLTFFWLKYLIFNKNKK